MPEPEEARFACVGCGAMNPVGAEVCQGCGHRFAGTSAGTPSPKKQETRPIRRGGGLLAFVKVTGGVFLVLLSSLIAFVGTCVPITLAGMYGEFQISVAWQTFSWLTAGAMALLVGFGVTRFLRRGRRKGHPDWSSREDRP